MALQPEDALRITSANLNGIRSAASKGFFDWMGQHRPDVVCVQELKAQPADLTPVMRAPHGYHGFFHCAEKKGYSGVGIYSRTQPDRVIEGMGEAAFDAEGRYLRADFGNLSVVSVYVPSGSSSEERQALRKTVSELGRKFGPEYMREKIAAGEGPTELWKAAGDLGLIGVNISEQYGGGGAGIDAAIQGLVAFASCAIRGVESRDGL